MSEVVTDLLVLSRIARQEIHRTPVDLGAIARSFLAELKTSAPGRDVRFDSAAGLTVEADESLVRILLENLIRNAWKYSSKNEHAHIEFGAIMREGRRVFFIRDNGVGFDMTQSVKLFKPFQRLHSEDHFKGTGMGLATVKRIVDKHGGAVWAEAEPGKGAAFYFRLQ
jgi:light-regulated signal transduction histidine kinase (bacteriophytochrome)